MNIVTIGSATQDIFITYDNPELLQKQTERGVRNFLVLEEGSKLTINDIQYHTGGGATNTAVSFTRLGLSTQAFFKVGKDAQGDFILQQLNAEGIDSTLALQQPTVKTAVSFILTCPSGERSALVYRGASLTLTYEEVPLQALESCTALYVSPLSGNAMQMLLPVTKHAKHNGALVAVNPSCQQLENGAPLLTSALNTIDILILNTLEATLLLHSLEHSHTPFDLIRFCTTILQQGPRIVVVTDGARGVHVATKEGMLYYHPSVPVSVVNTLGAGDAFGSCFVAMIVQGMSIQDAIRAGIINSASVVGQHDAKAGLLTKSVVEKKLQALDTTLLQTATF